MRCFCEQAEALVYRDQETEQALGVRQVAYQRKDGPEVRACVRALAGSIPVITSQCVREGTDWIYSRHHIASHRYLLDPTCDSIGVVYAPIAM